MIYYKIKDSQGLEKLVDMDGLSREISQTNYKLVLVAITNEGKDNIFHFMRTYFVS